MSEATVLLVGAEPAAFAVALSLLEASVPVHHIYCQPLGLCGASRDIGLAYPELGEPLVRLEHAIGEDLARRYHRWSRLGLEDLEARFPELFERGSRLTLTRTETESKLVAEDALYRSSEAVGDQVRLMSGAAASNYAPVDGAHQASFETHALSFTPVKSLEGMASQLNSHPHYRVLALSMEDWQKVRVRTTEEGVRARVNGQDSLAADMGIVAAGSDCGRVLGNEKDWLQVMNSVCFRSPPLKEKSRSSVVGLTASWGYERYRFDPQRRLLACGLDPSRAFAEKDDPSEFDQTTLEKFSERASQLFTDLEVDTESFLKWEAQFCSSCDGLPVVGALPGQNSLQILEGFGLHAWSRGWWVGRLMGALVTDGQIDQLSQELLKSLSPQRFKVR